MGITVLYGACDILLMVTPSFLGLTTPAFVYGLQSVIERFLFVPHDKVLFSRQLLLSIA